MVFYKEYFHFVTFIRKAIFSQEKLLSAKNYWSSVGLSLSTCSRALIVRILF